MTSRKPFGFDSGKNTEYAKRNNIEEDKQD